MTRFLLLPIVLVCFFFGSFTYAQSDSLSLAVDKMPDDTSKVRVLLDLCLRNRVKDRFKSFEFAKQALLLSEQLKDHRAIGNSLNQLGDLYWYSGDYTSASDNYFKALKIFEQLNDQRGIAECYRNIGWIYQGQSNFELTLEYYFKSLEINTALNITKGIIANYDDITIAYKLMGKYEESLEYGNQTIELSKQANLSQGIATGYINIASIYFEMKKYELAIENFESSNTILLRNEDYYNLAEGYNGVAQCYLASGMPKKSIEAAGLSLEIARKYNYDVIALEAYSILSKSYAMNKDYQNAYKYLNQFTGIRESTYNEKNSRQINEMSAKYESDKKELVINALEKDKELSNQKLAQEQKFKIFLTLFCVMIGGFAFFLYKGNVQKRKTNNSLSLAYKQIEVKNKDITDSINYAKRIQDAILPTGMQMDLLFNEADYFVLYKPKDIVSGDFYWAEKQEDNTIIAVADCTGHGVPGAFMSIVGNNLLKQAVNINGLHEPALILNDINKELSKILHQENTSNIIRDGMDISVCSISKKTMMLQYAGAYNPLWLLRSGKLYEYPGDRFPVGAYEYKQQLFTNHKIPVEKNDLVFIFSDGYADQFGGKDGKKFKLKKLKDTLLAISNEPLKEQKEILNRVFEEWKDDLEQIDDVCLAGIRI